MAEDALRVTLRVTSHPVQGVPITASPIIRRGRTIDNSVNYEITWYRGKSVWHCASPGCPRHRGKRSGIQLSRTASVPHADKDFSYCDITCLSYALRNPQTYEYLYAGAPAQRDFMRSSTLYHDARAQQAVPLAAAAQHSAQQYSPAAAAAALASAAESALLAPADVTPSSGAAATGASAAAPSGGSSSSEEWKVLGTGNTYTPVAEDVWHKLKVVVTVAGGQAEPASSTCPAVFPPPLPAPARPLAFARSLKSKQRAKLCLDDFSRLRQGLRKTPARCAPDSLRVVTYNILAELFATAQQYPESPAWALAWPYRFQLVLTELQTVDADIICLQEVQGNHFTKQFMPALERLGYDGVFKQKTREAMGEAGQVDGCAMFWKTARLRAKSSFTLDYNEAALRVFGERRNAATDHEPLLVKSLLSGAAPVDDSVAGTPSRHTARTRSAAGGEKGHRMLKRAMRDNVAQLVVFELLGAPARNSQVVVANTHLFWDPRFADVKLWQASTLAQQLARLCSDGQDMRLAPSRLILCGDFNSEPQTAVPRLLGINAEFGAPNSQLPPSAYPEDPEGLISLVGNLGHGLMLRSAYQSVLQREPAYTNFTSGYRGAIDYVWYDALAFEAVSVQAIPTRPALATIETAWLPNACYPSDHLCLVTDLRVRSPEDAMTQCEAVMRHSNASSSMMTGASGRSMSARPAMSGMPTLAPDASMSRQFMPMSGGASMPGVSAGVGSFAGGSVPMSQSSAVFSMGMDARMESGSARTAAMMHPGMIHQRWANGGPGVRTQAAPAPSTRSSLFRG